MQKFVCLWVLIDGRSSRFPLYSHVFSCQLALRGKACGSDVFQRVWFVTLIDINDLAD